MGGVVKSCKKPVFGKRMMTKYQTSVVSKLI